jgi:hypothetical protein
LNVSVVVSLLVVVAVLAMVVGLAAILVHPHVCSLMQGDWCAEVRNDPPGPV